MSHFSHPLLFPLKYAILLGFTADPSRYSIPLFLLMLLLLVNNLPVTHMYLSCHFPRNVSLIPITLLLELRCATPSPGTFTVKMREDELYRTSTLLWQDHAPQHLSFVLGCCSIFPRKSDHARCSRKGTDCQAQPDPGI